MTKQNAKIDRLSRGTRKLVRRFFWRLLGLFTKKPTIDILYQSEDKKSVVFCCHGPVYIEPESGYLISERGYLMEETLLPNFPFEERPFGITVPSPFDFFKSIKQPEKVTELDTAVSLRHFWEWNYYHFYLDVLGKLELLQAAGVDERLPLVIAKYADDVPFVRPLIERGEFANRQWVVPTATEYIKANKVIFCRTRNDYELRVQFILNALRIDQVNQEDDKRLYLMRSSNRRVTNSEEIEALLQKYGFQTIDAAEMSIDEQIEAFSKVRYLVANHGAGTTNILFRGNNPLSVLELHHENYMNVDHKRMCDEMGYQWDFLEGTMGIGTPAHADFSVSPAKLEQKIIGMLSASNAQAKH